MHFAIAIKRASCSSIQFTLQFTRKLIDFQKKKNNWSIIIITFVLATFEILGTWYLQIHMVCGNSQSILYDNQIVTICCFSTDFRIVFQLAFCRMENAMMYLVFTVFFMLLVAYGKFRAFSFIYNNNKFFQENQITRKYSF